MPERALGLKRADRVLIQRGLNGLKLDAGPADGLYGPKTRGALRKWQVLKGLAATGYVTADQAKALVATGREVKVAVGIYPGSPGVVRAPSRSVGGPGSVFRDCANCPEMVVIPAGSFQMGDLSGGGAANEKPVHGVTISRSFAVGKFEVTFSEWDACVSSGGCSHRPDDRGWGRDRRPVIYVSWDDAQSYIKWISAKTGKGYRLLSESEWEYVARAGSTTEYPWGSEVGSNRANCSGCGSSWDGTQTAPVGSFSSNRFGLHDTVGNVWEWVGDCWNWSYAGAPSDGSAQTGGDCSRRVLRGGSWSIGPRYVRSADRDGARSAGRGSDFGFRLARTL
jgi:formylglycine-generating enzyme required for sulfatase activity